MSGKTHHTAVAAVPPEEVWEPIQAIRRRHDRQINRWMPHINLLYPFRPRDRFHTVVPDLAAACASTRPFKTTLGKFSYFRHGSGRCTLWLAPEPAGQLQRLRVALQGAFPDCDDLARFPASFTPHLSVGQFRSAADCERCLAELQGSWEPVTFVLDEVALLAREREGPFVTDRRIPLGKGSEDELARPD
jgi:2'-5' RNA ligase